MGAAARGPAVFWGRGELQLKHVKSGTLQQPSKITKSLL